MVLDIGLSKATVFFKRIQADKYSSLIRNFTYHDRIAGLSHNKHFKGLN